MFWVLSFCIIHIQAIENNHYGCINDLFKLTMNTEQKIYKDTCNIFASYISTLIPLVCDYQNNSDKYLSCINELNTIEFDNVSFKLDYGRRAFDIAGTVNLKMSLETLPASFLIGIFRELEKYKIPENITEK